MTGFRSALKSVRSAGWIGLAALALWGASLLAPLAAPARPGPALPAPAARPGSFTFRAPRAPVPAPLVAPGQTPEAEFFGDGLGDPSLIPTGALADLPSGAPEGSGGYLRPGPWSLSGGTVHGTRGRPPPGAGG